MHNAGIAHKDESGKECQIETDLIDNFGIGVSSYFSLIKIMIFVFFLLTLLHIPVFHQYYSGQVYNDNKNLSDKQRLFLTTSLGNLGHSVATCLHQYIDIDEPFHIKCYKGKLTSSISHFML